MLSQILVASQAWKAVQLIIAALHECVYYLQCVCVYRCAHVSACV